jgi:acyl-coenzyme A thioesterase PaaI-like protein
MRPIGQADALLEAKLMRLGKTLTFCRCGVSVAGTDKPAAYATATYALLE